MPPSAAKTWINLNDDFSPLKDTSLIWGSERSGFHHLYRFWNGQWTPITKGQWVVTGLVGIDEEHHRLYFAGNKDGALEQQLYSVDYLEPREPRRLSDQSLAELVRRPMDPAARVQPIADDDDGRLSRPGH